MTLIKRRLLASCLVMTGALTFTYDLESRAPAQPADKSQSVQVIEVTAKKYEFDPSPIRVKQGTRVQLKITASDHTHGFRVSPFPEGDHASGSSGLVFLSPQGCQEIQKHQTVVVEFVAQTAGTYPFRCCKVCGWHHRAMKGELIVEP